MKINDKHIEVIVRQMLRRVQIVEAGDANYIAGKQVERSEVLDENDRVTAAGNIPAKANMAPELQAMEDSTAAATHQGDDE